MAKRAKADCGASLVERSCSPNGARFALVARAAPVAWCPRVFSHGLLDFCTMPVAALGRFDLFATPSANNPICAKRSPARAGRSGFEPRGRPQSLRPAGPTRSARDVTALTARRAGLCNTSSRRRRCGRYGDDDARAAGSSCGAHDGLWGRREPDHLFGARLRGRRRQGILTPRTSFV
jgi:hypothetical protein